MLRSAASDLGAFMFLSGMAANVIAMGFVAIIVLGAAKKRGPMALNFFLTVGYFTWYLGSYDDIDTFELDWL